MKKTAKSQTAKSKKAGYPRVKIYFLKNENPVKQYLTSNTQPIGYPSVSFISSFIQKRKDNLSIEQNYGLQSQSSPKKLKNIAMGLLQNSSVNSNEIIQNNLNRIQQYRKIQTANVAEAKAIHTLKQIQQGHYDPTFNDYKRLIKSSHQKYTKTLGQNKKVQEHIQQNATKDSMSDSKDYLCNIVKEWSSYQDKKQKRFRFSNRKKTIQPWKRHYSDEEVDELRKNKTLMKDHFNLFLQNQNRKSTVKKEPSVDILQAVFHRQQSDDIHNKQDQKKSKLKLLNLSLKPHTSFRRERAQSTGDSFLEKGRRALSCKQKDYVRLLQGPQVKLMGNMFQNKYKIKNFNWTKLDKTSYSGKQKTLDEEQNAQMRK